MSGVTAFLSEWWAVTEVRAAAVVVAAILLGKVVDFVLCGGVRLLARRSKTDVDDKLIEQLHRPIYVSVVLFGLLMANNILALPSPFFWIVAGIVKTLIALIWTFAGLRAVSTLLEGVGQLAHKVQWLEARTVPLFDNVAKIIIFGAAIYLLLTVWGLDVRPALASAGIVGLALGFAAKDTLANLFSGLFIIIDAPYAIGDFINLGSGERGEVTRIGLRSTRILTRDDIEVTIPNAVIGNSTIVNESGGRWVKTRVAIQVGVEYGSDVDRVREVLIEAAKSVKLALPDPEPRIRFMEMGDSGLIFRILVWIGDPVLRGECIDALNTAVYNGLGAASINIPFPQRDVHVKQALPA